MSDTTSALNNTRFLESKEFPKVPFVLNGISSRFIQENKVIPLDLRNNVLKIIMANPHDRDTIDALRVSLSSDILVYGADELAVEEYISKFYGRESENINKIIEDMGEKGL